MSTTQLILDILTIVFLILLWKIYSKLEKFNESCLLFKMDAIAICILLMIIIFKTYIRFL